MPADESLLTEFVAIKYPSIKIYLAAVRHYHIHQRFQLSIHKMLRLKLMEGDKGQNCRIARL